MPQPKLPLLKTKLKLRPLAEEARSRVFLEK